VLFYSIIYISSHYRNRRFRNGGFGTSSLLLCSSKSREYWPWYSSRQRSTFFTCHRRTERL